MELERQGKPGEGHAVLAGRILLVNKRVRGRLVRKKNVSTGQKVEKSRACPGSG